MAVVICSSNYLVQFPFNYFQLNEIITWGAFTYPVSFFITELANRFFGKKFARKVVFAGFLTGLILSFILSLQEFIVSRIVIGSGIAFLAAQLLDIKVFDFLRNKSWFIPPLVSSLLCSLLDTILFFSIAFYGTDINWITLALGDFTVKLLVDFVMLLPFRLAISKYKVI
ncbi:MAG: VUT family protein [Proteobacteria bacterium]|jgi:queuosine precursor transporter|nr:VUT family protein [Candidatus Fonsibacter sp. PEL5]NKA16452.1 VUT family protein [Candidatus Fonsibacter sp. PEL55]